MDPHSKASLAARFDGLLDKQLAELRSSVTAEYQRQVVQLLGRSSPRPDATFSPRSPSCEEQSRQLGARNANVDDGLTMGRLASERSIASDDGQIEAIGQFGLGSDHRQDHTLQVSPCAKKTSRATVCAMKMGSNSCDDFHANGTEPKTPSPRLAWIADAQQRELSPEGRRDANSESPFQINVPGQTAADNTEEDNLPSRPKQLLIRHNTLELKQFLARDDSRDKDLALGCSAGPSIMKRPHSSMVHTSSRSSDVTVLTDASAPPPRTGRVSLAASLPDPAARASSSCSNNSEHLFELHPIYEVKDANRRSLRQSQKMQRAKTQGALGMGRDALPEELHKESFMSKYIIHPGSATNISWDIVGLVLIAYDCFVIPLSFFDPSDTQFTMAASWMLRIYWTLNIVTSFFTGYIDTEGNVVQREAAIAKRYMLTWFALDSFIVLSDWLEEAVVLGDEDAGYHRVGVAFRGLRMIRTVRLLRMAKLQVLFTQLTDQLRTEELLLMAHIAKIMIAMMAAAHFIACIYYGIGMSKANGWVEEIYPDPLSKPLANRYFLSLHWSLSMFVGETLVTPYNLRERIFAASVLFIGFMLTAALMGSLTTAMTRLQLIRSEHTQQLAQLRRFLVHRAVSRPLAVRVQRNAQHQLMEQKRTMPEDSVALLKLISDPLKVELHFEAYSMQLMTHPFFACFNEVNPVGMRKICHHAVSFMSLSVGDVLFSDHEEPTNPRMFFVMHGKLEYAHNDYAEVAVIGSSTWVCEAVLWTKWVHCGTLRAISESKLMALDAKKFQNIMGTLISMHVTRYGESFVYNLNQQAKVEHTDYEELTEEMEDSLCYAYPEILEEDESEYTSDQTVDVQRSASIRSGGRETHKENNNSRRRNVLVRALRRNFYACFGVGKKSRSSSAEQIPGDRGSIKDQPRWWSTVPGKGHSKNRHSSQSASTVGAVRAPKLAALMSKVATAKMKTDLYR